MRGRLAAHDVPSCLGSACQEEAESAADVQQSAPAPGRMPLKKRVVSAHTSGAVEARGLWCELYVVPRVVLFLLVGVLAEIREHGPAACAPEVLVARFPPDGLAFPTVAERAGALARNGLKHAPRLQRAAG